MIEQLMVLEAQFWSWVEQDTEPPADGTDSADQALRCLYPRDSGMAIDLSDDLEMSAVFSDLIAVRQVLESQARLEAQLKQRIQQRMADASLAQFEQGTVTWKRSKDSDAVDMKQLSQDNPELVQRYSSSKPGSRRFLITANSDDA